MESMQRIVENFVNTKNNGLCLINMPTGTGKTFLTIKMMAAYIRGEILRDVKTVVYLTPQKKNIDSVYDDLKDEFEADISEFDKNVLRIYANYESVLANFLRVYENMQPQIKNKQSCRDLKKRIEFYKEMSDKGVTKEILEVTLSEIRKNYEVAFRHDLSEELTKRARTKRGKLNLLNGEFAWVKELYPACLTEYRKVLFMTVDKFFLGNDPIIAKPYRFITHSKFKEALIFIDEFDATKDVILNQEIQNCSDYKMDLIKLFSSISNTLKGREFPISIYAESLDEEDKTSSISCFNQMKKHFLEVEQKYNLNYLFKLESPDESGRYFLFDDYQLHTVTNACTEKNIVLEEDKRRKQNTIKILEKSDDGKFFRTIYALKNAINVFVSCCSRMAEIYLKNFNDSARASKKDMMEIEQAVSTIIDPFNLDYVMAKNIISMIVGHISIPVVDRGIDVFDTDFYMNGFRYYDFKDDLSHDVSTSMAMSYLESTPEKFMLSLANRARVVGLSATATIKTVTGNYDFEYLQDKLGDSIYKLSAEERDNLRKYVEGRLHNSDGINVFVEKIDESQGNSVEDIVSQLFKDASDVEGFTGKLAEYCQNGSDPNYDIKRFLRALKAAKAFMSSAESRILLVMTNRNVTEHSWKNIYNRSNIDEAINALCEELNVRKPKIYFMNSAEFAEQKENYKNDVKNGEKVLLFSSYNTAGTGQNLQFEVGDKEIDIDSIYLELPTNLLVNIKDLKDESNAIKLIYQNEALKTRGEITKKDALKNIKSAFKKMMSNSEGGNFSYNSAYDSDSVNNHIVKVLIQAVGRICRTENKNDNISIYVDEQILQKICFSSALDDDIMLNPEFQMIVDLEAKELKKDRELTRNLYKANDRNARVKNRIEAMLNENRVSWSERDIKQWRYMREFVLKHPTISKEELAVAIRENYSIKDFYLEARDGEKICSYLYQKLSYDEENIFYDYYPSKIEGAIKINENDSRLTNIIRIPAVRQKFSELGYATAFEKNDCMILPVVYQNIYKGALGEVAGSAILESYGINLVDIDDLSKFEKFDFCLASDPEIYFDFKNWSDKDEVDRDEYKEKCIRKLEKIGGKKVFVINVASNNYSMHKSYGGRLIEISSLCRYDTKKGLFYLLDSDKIKQIYNEIFGAFDESNN